MIHVPSPGRPALPSLLFHCSSSNSRNEPERPQQQGGRDDKRVMRCSPSTQTTTPLWLLTCVPCSQKNSVDGQKNTPNAPTPTKPTTQKKSKPKQTNKHTAPNYYPNACMHIRQAGRHPPPCFMSKNLTVSMDWCKYTSCQMWYLHKSHTQLFVGDFE
jgi:hypothetical protein